MALRIAEPRSVSQYLGSAYRYRAALRITGVRDLISDEVKTGTGYLRVRRITLGKLHGEFADSERVPVNEF